MNLIDDLKHGAIAGPTSRKFKIEKWEEILDDEDLTSDEVEIVGLAIWFHALLARLRKNLKFALDSDTEVSPRFHAGIPS
jgi:hypothetical protein